MKRRTSPNDGINGRPKTVLATSARGAEGHPLVRWLTRMWGPVKTLFLIGGKMNQLTNGRPSRLTVEAPLIGTPTTRHVVWNCG